MGVKLNMTVNELALFKKNTDAIGTNRGFLYQYLKTLNSWVRNFIEEKEVVIYCETDDDIKELDLINAITRFTQVKCYSTAFSIKSEDIQKSIFNFFILYAEYGCDYSGEFYFITNSSVNKSSELLEKWSQTKGAIDEKLLEEIVPVIRGILIDHFSKTKESFVKRYKEMINTRKEKISENEKLNEKIVLEIEQIENKKRMVLDQYDKAIAFVDQEDILIDFIGKIKWQFDNISAEASIEELKKENLELVSKIKGLECVPNLMVGRLLTEVFHKSSEKLVEHRTLSNELIIRIIKESEEEIYQKADGILIGIYNRFDSIEEKIQILIERENEDKDKKIEEMEKFFLPEFHESKIQSLVEKGEKENQSNLEKKINNIGLGNDERTLVGMVTKARCTYLLYLDQLRLEGLVREYQVLKSLENSVRRLCFKAVRKNEKESDFNPHDFWIDFEDVLYELSKDFEIKFDIKIDEGIVFAQMYQIAAECPLRWHKE
ncbi:hypothetical protein ACFTQL_20365 [Peribacillus butanolivorans]|uniref:hypothetical protein n=1 Tax=Peribacillus butanolivorans TaxID=421767 RepID=UPI003630CDD4